MKKRFLTQISVDMREAAKKKLVDCYDWHRALWEAFPDRDGQPRSFLFRVDNKLERFRVLLLSEHRPTVPSWGEWETKEVSASFLSHERYMFQIRSNATVRQDGKRIGIYDLQKLQDWLERKAIQSGFAVLEYVAGPAMAHYFTKDGKTGKHSSVDFQGLLRVTDQAAFMDAFTRGIGPAKAFGFGLLMLQPA
jgi:CRISPR system Cascade subunit CasE